MRAWILLSCAVLLQPDTARAWGSPALLHSQGGTISGVVKDPSGTPIPGVTVEVSSPALIEQSRAAVTDEQGRYRIAALPSGTYLVTFASPGFSTIRRENIELSSSFTATVNAEIGVDTVQEAATVSDSAPGIDTQDVSQKAITPRQVMDALPTDRTFISFAALSPGMLVVGGVQNVGGSNPENALMLRLHGSRIGESRLFVDGMSVMSGQSTGGLAFGNFLNNAMAQEIVVKTDSLSAEFELSGVTSNVITRQGSNVLRGSFTGRYTSTGLQGENLTDDLVAQGLTSSNRIDKIWDVNPSVGGPLVKDRAWIFASGRHWGTYRYIAGLYDDLDPTALFYTPDVNSPAIQPVWHASGDLRLTVQATRRNKVDAYYHVQQSDFGTCPAPSRTTAPSACGHSKNVPQWFAQASWTAPISTSVLMEAGATITAQAAMGRRDPGVSSDLPSITESTTAFTWRAPAGGFGGTRNNQSNYRAAVSYVTTAHSIKVGATLLRLWRRTGSDHNGGVNYTFRNRTEGDLTSAVPVRLTQFAEPLNFSERVNYNLGLYAQDQWRLGRATINLGVRADFLNTQVDAQHLPAGRLIGERDFAEVGNVPNWRDLSPRLGVAYDLHGNGKTAIKATLARYVAGESYGIARALNPLESTVSSANRAWNDSNGNFTPDCDLAIVTPNGECGAANPLTFGQTVVRTAYDPDLTNGFGVRPYNWSTSVTVQHELFPRVTVGGGYFRRWFGNFHVTQNRAVTNADFAPYCITAPESVRLPGGGGYEVCGFYDVNVGKFGHVDNLITDARKFGTQEDVFDGFDFTFDVRMPGRAFVSGGLSLGRLRTNTCDVIENLGLVATASAPRATPFCDVRPPMQPNVKIQAVYPLPWWQIQAAATFQSLVGAQLLAQQDTLNAQILPSLRRNLSSCRTAACDEGSIVLDLVPPGTLYGDRINQVDLRVSKTMRVGRVSVRPTVSVYNLLNASPVLQYNNRYNASWPAPTTILMARFVDFGVQVDF